MPRYQLSRQKTVEPRLSRRSLLAAGLGAFAVNACKILPSPLSGTFKVGLVAPFSGRDNQFGYNLLFAVKLALKELNEQGGIHGWRVELLANDDHNEEANGVLQARKLTVDPDVVAVLGHPGNASALAAAPEYRRAAVPFLTFASADPLTGPGVFRFAASDSMLVSRIVSYLSDKLGVSQLAIVVGDATSGKFGEILSKEWWDKAGAVVFGDGLASEITDLGPAAERILASRPQAVVYAGGVEQGAPLYAEIRRLAPGVHFVMTPETASPQFAKLIASPTDFAYFITPGTEPTETPAAHNFIRTYRATWAVEPWPQAVLAYDATGFLIEAVRRVTTVASGPTRQSLMSALGEIDLYNAILGPARFNDRGEWPLLPITIFRMNGGRFPGDRVSPV